MNWLDQLLSQHEEFETPTSFWMWAGLVSISAVVKDNVWLNRHLYTLYPNIYCVLHADSGLKKGPAVALAKDLVSTVKNTRVISGRSSIQGIVKQLGTGYTIPGGKVVNKAVGFINASELSASLVTDPAALTILTDLYDRQYHKDKYESILKMEQFALKQPTVSLFGGINNAHAEQFFEKKDIRGGFFARTFIVYEREEANINSLARRPLISPNIPQLTEYLKELAKLSGPFADLDDENRILSPVGEYYEEWYQTFRKTCKEEEIRDETGTLNRIGDSVLKIAMLLSLAEEPKLEISMQSMELAVKVAERLVGNIRRVATDKLSQADDLAQKKWLILNELVNRDNHRISQKLLMSKYVMTFDSEELVSIMRDFHDAGHILIKNIANQTIYEMPEQYAQELKKHWEGKSISKKLLS